MRAVVTDPRLPLREHSAGVVDNSDVETLGAERAADAVGPDSDLHGYDVTAGDHGRKCNWLLLRNGLCDVCELGAGKGVDRSHQDVEDAATGEPDRESVVVTDAVRLQDGDAVAQHLLGDLVDRSLDASAGHASDDLAGGADGHRGARLPGCGLPCPDDRPDADRFAGPPPGLELGQHVTHRRSRPPGYAARPGCVRRAVRRRGGGRRSCPR